MKIHCLLSLLALTTLAPAADLDESYTLGRILAPELRSFGLADVQNGTTVGTSILEYRFGEADSWSLGIPFSYSHAGKDSRSVSIYTLGGAELSLHPAPGLMLDAKLSSGNLWVIVGDNSTNTGFEQGVPFLVGTDFYSHFLSNQGLISIDNQKAPFAFLYGPTMNANQFEVYGHLKNTFADSSELQGYSLGGAFGLAEDIQLRAAFQDTLDKLIYEFGPETYVFEKHIQRFVAGGDWVSQAARAGAWFQQNSSDKSALPHFDNGAETWNLHLYGGYLGGAEGALPEEVAGNWNGLFSQNLNAKQFDLEDTLRIGLDGETLNLTGSARYGVLDQLTAGVHYTLTSAKETSKTVRLFAAFSNIPKRTDGPADVSPLEYLKGVLPKSGEAMLASSFRLPFSDGDTWEDFSSLQTDPFSAFQTPWESARRGWIRTSSPEAFFDIFGIYGLSDNLFIDLRVSKVDFFSSAMNSPRFDVEDAWIFNPGLSIHSESVALSVRVPFYTGTGVRFYQPPSYRLVIGQDSRLGPVQFSIDAVF